MLVTACSSISPVESELARDSREAVRDFQKLVRADCENKLFVGPQVDDSGAFRRPLGAVAARCRGTTYAAFVPHPDTWDKIRASGAAQAWASVRGARYGRPQLRTADGWRSDHPKPCRSKAVKG